MQAKITKQEIRELELIEYTGNIHLIDTPDKARNAQELFQKLTKEYKETGLDTESRPSFKKTDNFHISLIQVSFEDECFLFRLNKIECPDYLRSYLESDEIIKSGVALKDDCRDLRKQFQIHPKGIVDVQDLAKEQGYITLGLMSLTGILLGRRISKKAKLTNWENKTLTPAQIKYAATDAWISLKLYEALINKKNS